MADQHIGSNTPTVMRRSRDDRIGIAGGDFGFVLVLGCLLMLLVVSIDPDPSDWSLVLVGVAVTATEVAVVLRAMRSEVRLMGDNLVISRALPTKVVAVSAVRSVWETTRFRRVSTTTLHLEGGRTFRTKAATKRQMDSLLETARSR